MVEHAYKCNSCKSGLISGEKSNNRDVNQEHQLVGSKKPKTVKDESKDLGKQKMVEDLNPRWDREIIAPKAIIEPWFNKRMSNPQKKKDSSNLPTDFIKKKDNMERKSQIHSSDSIEKQTDLKINNEVFLAPVKSSKSTPAQVGNEETHSTDIIENQIDLEVSLAQIMVSDSARWTMRKAVDKSMLK